MAINVGDKVPSVTLKRLGEKGLEDIPTDQIFRGRKVVLFSVPGAFTPTCSKTHLPGYVEQASEIKAKGIDEIICLSVNDPFVMKAWGDEHKSQGKVTMLADGNGELTRALGLSLDLAGIGLGTRGKRFSMIVEDGVVKSVNVESDAKVVDVSGAKVCLTALSQRR